MNNIISRRWLQAVSAALLLLCFAVRPAYAVSITLGSRIDITSNTFALPIQIVDAVGVSEWFLDLTYDPTDVQVNVGCDPFSGDIYCSLFTGPVTEGDFFAAGAPFNLLIPGFVELDPVTFMQTGRLFGMHGAFGGFPPAPSGSGILAYIQFTLLGDGDSPMDPDGGVISVPEPGALVLFVIGLAWLVGRRMLMRVACGVVASLAICGAAAAQFGPSIDPPDLPTVMPGPIGGYPPTVAATAAGTYLAPPAWGQTLAPNVRFVILSNFDNDAVLDRETGLVWTRHKVTEKTDSFNADRACRSLHMGRRYGWRLPTSTEVLSLIDRTATPGSGEPKFPAGHPFVFPPVFGTNLTWYWVNDASFDSMLFVSLGSGALSFAQDTTFARGVMCVRGGEKNP